jgi:DNA-binding IclR family transcriptional regulator
LLAHGPQCVVDQLIEDGLVAYTERTITSPQELLAELEKVRAQGYAVTDQELEIGRVAASALVWDADNAAVAALGISGPPTGLDTSICQTLSPIFARPRNRYPGLSGGPEQIVASGRSLACLLERLGGLG